MKTITKLVSGLLLASTLMVGCSFHASSSSSSTQTTEVTDKDGNTTTTTTENGKTTTTTTKGFKKDVTIVNNTSIKIGEVDYKTDLDKDYDDLFNFDELGKGKTKTVENITFKEGVKTVSFKVQDEYGEEYTVKSVDISGIKDLDKVTFTFTQSGDTISCQLTK